MGVAPKQKLQTSPEILFLYARSAKVQQEVKPNYPREINFKGPQAQQDSRATNKMVEEPSPKANADTFSSAGGGSGMTIDECQGLIERSLRTPMVKFLKEHLEKAGCSFGDKFIKAVRCNEQVSGGYTRGEGIIVCSNHMNIQDEVNQVVIHELIHAYDDCRAANLNWANCAHHACSEIRAGHLSGDCHYKRELLRGFMKIRGHEQECVRRRVMKSLINNPYCSEAAAKDAMEAVWDVCYNDTKPFDRAP